MSRESLFDVPLRELFHENTKKFYFGGSEEFEKRAPRSWEKTGYKSYETAKRVSLGAESETTSPIDTVIAARRSPAGFEEYAVSKAEIGAILRAAAGITDRAPSPDDHRRAYPSAGGNYPLEIYLTVFEGEDIDAGLYHYDVLDHSLAVLRQDIEPDSWEFMSLPEGNPSFTLFLTAVEQRMTRKYGNRGYRYILIETGHLMQNLCLIAQARGLGCRPYAHILEDDVGDYLGVDSGEWPLYAGVVGKPREG
jgi:SagB-type dehydrogenase family enzyme